MLTALQNLESNIMILRDGGQTSEVRIGAIDKEFLDDWQKVYGKWLLFNIEVNTIISDKSGDASTTRLDLLGGDLVASADSLVTRLGENALEKSQQAQMLQIALGVVNIGVSVVIVFVVTRILRPIKLLSKAALTIKSGNLDTRVESSGATELRELADSFNSMVAALKESTSMLQTSKKRYEELYEGAPDLYRSVDTSGKIIDCNKSYVLNLGYTSKKEVIGHSMFEHVAESSQEEAHKNFEEWKAKGRVTNKKSWMKRKDGSVFPISLSATSIFDELTGELISSNTVITDQSEQYALSSSLQKANEQLKQLGTLKDEFVNVAAHELRTPIVPIILNAEELADDYQHDPRLGTILRNAKRLSRLTTSILDAARIESKTFKLIKENSNIVTLVQECIQDIQSKIPETKSIHIIFSNHLDKSNVNFLIDRLRIGEVITNLLHNANKFTDIGTITVSLEQSAEMITISVADMGKGIDQLIEPKLFQKFSTKSDRITGTGLGLYLCRAIIEAHDGKIWAENKKNERGAIFTFTLPVGTVIG